MTSHPTVWVDSNVMAEVFTQGDIHRDAPRGVEHLERRRMMLQGSYWLAMALDEQALVTSTLKTESHDAIKNLAPLDDDVAIWTHFALHVLTERVFPRWQRLGSGADEGIPKGREGNNPRDVAMVAEARALGVKALVTRDKAEKRGQLGAYALANASGVPPSTPEEYASAVLPWKTARDRFLGRLRHVPIGEGAVKTYGDVEAVLDVYGVIWEPAGYWA